MKYYHVKIFPKQNPQDWEWIPNLTREKLDQRLLDPYRAAEPITIRGKTTCTDELERITIDETDARWGDHRVCRDATDDFITGPPGSEAAIGDVAHLQSKAVGESIHEREDQAFINAVTDFDDA